MIREPGHFPPRIHSPVISRILPIFLLTLIAIPVLNAQPRQKVIVLGFDGVDAAWTERFMDEGELPNLDRLRREGTFRPLLPTLPAQTPVSWSTFATGMDPGRTGIFDFLRRDPQTYMPVFAAFDEVSVPFAFGERNALVAGVLAFVVLFLMFTLLARLVRGRWRSAAVIGLMVALPLAAGAGWWTSEYLPTHRPGVVNRQQGTPFWEVAGAAGLKSKIVHVPVTFPAKDFEGGHLLSGLGVPDISGRVGKPFYFTSELDFRPHGGSNEFSIEVVRLEDNRGVIQTEIAGPPNRLFGDPPYIKAPVTFTVADDQQSIRIDSGDSSAQLRAGEWSDWFAFEFAFNSVVKIRGISRFFCISIAPEVRVYLSPINFDPSRLPPGMKVSAPGSWAPELARQHGSFKTMGWAIDTWAVSEGFANEQMFWDDMEWTVDQYRGMFQSFLTEDQDLLVQCFEFPDRVGHVFWRMVDPQHPAHQEALVEKWGDALLRSYKLMDSIVGEARAAADRSGAVLIVLSDHGFATWRRSINYNTWLVQNGYLVLRSGVETKERDLELLFDQGEFWENVDWSRSRAYAMGLGNVYINLAGREAQGIVQAGAEYDRLKQEIAAGLEAIVDPETGEKPVSRVVLREEAYEAFDPNLIPDLFVTNNPGYRVSWQTSLGGIQKEMIEINPNIWSGDHCSLDPELVKGIFFINKPLRETRPPYIGDIYPTVLDLLGVRSPYEADGVVLR